MIRISRVGTKGFLTYQLRARTTMRRCDAPADGHLEVFKISMKYEGQLIEATPQAISRKSS
jgi:hypothetical protein